MLSIALQVCVGSPSLALLAPPPLLVRAQGTRVSTGRLCPGVPGDRPGGGWSEALPQRGRECRAPCSLWRLSVAQRRTVSPGARRRECACGRREFMHVWLQPERVRVDRAPGCSSLWRSFALMAGRVLSV